MRLFLLTVALLLMAAALTSPFWFQPSMSLPTSPGVKRTLVSGRIKGDFPDHPWVGTMIYFGKESAPLTEDGAFSFAVPPGIHILRVCCSHRFERIYREIEVEDRDLYFELEARALRQISGRVEVPPGKPLKYTLQLSAWLIGTNTVDRTIVASDGSFVLRLSEGDWRVDLDNLKAAHRLQSISLDGVAVHDRKFKISDVHGPSLPLQITLK
jgi:hypothetical protein